MGADVEIQVERGRRIFASGDRVMFLKNDRGLGIKNGSLGVVETVSRQQMTVRINTGRSVAFDLKDYAHLDHGYAATIHKAQGVTVDRVHVLATPGLDRHAAYVALSRHRDSVQLHYGRDDFVDSGKLARVLSRERAKDLASDYARDGTSDSRSEGARKAPERAEPQRGREHSIFAAFRPNPRAAEPAMQAPTGERISGRQVAIRLYARTVLDIARMQEQGLPVLPHQRQAHERARVTLDAVRPHAARDLESAFDRDPTLVGEAAQGRTQRAIRAMQAEAEIRNDPNLRAERFVEKWRTLDHQRAAFERGGNWQAAQTVRDSMGVFAKSLERDPQMESLLRNRHRELGLPMPGHSIGHDLIEHLGLGRGRSLST